MVHLLYYVWEGLVSNFNIETCYSKAYFVFLVYLSLAQYLMSTLIYVGWVA
jgi:hypothetical protein